MPDPPKLTDAELDEKIQGSIARIMARIEPLTSATTSAFSRSSAWHHHQTRRCGGRERGRTSPDAN